jgi:hypothetical protein
MRGAVKVDRGRLRATRLRTKELWDAGSSIAEAKALPGLIREVADMQVRAEDLRC